ncbi:MAG: aminotransferase class V-fold PLP-dependent enzyme [Gammaproteobacteria bacterium]|nr:aminotransferase class V-fold PLP-dependent enzyme [Gammaproteobacteria bacterium]
MDQLTQIYLDENATTPVLPQAAAAALAAMETLFGNPSSSHISGLQAKQIMDKTRHQATEIIGAGHGKVIFTSGATEGIQTAILSALCHARASIKNTQDYCLLYGATEHKAVPESLKHWNELLGINAQIKAIPVDKSGQLDLDFIAREVPNALMICTMAVNNETGVYQDIELLDQTIRGHNQDVFWMVDCVQALGKMSLNLANTSIDYAPFSGHKLYAPKGIGFVYIKENAPFTSFIAGGGQEGGLRSGTENLPGMAALSVIFSMLLNQSQHSFTPAVKLEQFRQQLVAALTTAFPSIVLNHHFDNSVPTTINFSVPNLSSKEMMDLFDAANIRVSSGSACSSKVTRSFVLDAMGLAQWQSESAIRMSFGPAMTQAQVDIACERIQLCAQALTMSCFTHDLAQTNNPVELAGLIQFKVGGSCTWLYVDNVEKTAVIIDPLPELEQRITTLLACQSLQLIAVIDTHGHADHVSCRGLIADHLLPNQHSDHLGWPLNSPSFTVDGNTYQYVAIGQQYLVKVATAGHTNDSISLLLCQSLPTTAQAWQVEYAFCGDTILIGSLGRTNFSTSSTDGLFSSLQQLHRLIGNNTIICPSHDYHNEFATSFSAELSRNKLLALVIFNGITLVDFSRQKTLLDQHIVDETGAEIMCGAFVGNGNKSQVKAYSSTSLGVAMAQSGALKLIDIREPHEYALGHDAQSYTNVPVSRLVQFVRQYQHNKQAPLALICRSGSRSHIAAQALARLGFSNIGHVVGGYALNSLTAE